MLPLLARVGLGVWENGLQETVGLGYGTKKLGLSIWRWYVAAFHNGVSYLHRYTFDGSKKSFSFSRRSQNKDNI